VEATFALTPPGDGTNASASSSEATG
jgi:hypothetical protein